jgi:hypothetical protein
MNKHPAGDFSDILAGLKDDRKPGGERRAQGPTANSAGVSAAAKRKAPKSERDKERFAPEDVERIGERIELRPRRTLGKLFAPLFRTVPMPAPPLGRHKPVKAEGSPAAAQPRTVDPAAKDEAPAPRRFRLPQFFKTISLASQIARFFPKILFRRLETPKPGRMKSAASAAEPAPAPSKSRRPRTEDEAIAAEMGLHPDLASADLKKIRRDFAKKNHPDRFEAPQRMSAARRMSIANMLIDEHLKRKPLAK